MRYTSLMVIAIVVLFFSATAIVQAGIYGPQITGVTATVNKSLTLGFPVANLVNDSGMSGDYQSLDGSYGWKQAISGGGMNAQITFDLGYLPPPYHYTVNAVKIWNWLYPIPSIMDTGVKDITLWSSTNGTSFTQIGSTYTLTENSTYFFPSGDCSYYPSGINDLIPLAGGVNARYIRLNVLSNYGNATWYGLGEVRFFGVDPIPEPNSLMLLVVSLASLIAYAWWKRSSCRI